MSVEAVPSCAARRSGPPERTFVRSSGRTSHLGGRTEPPQHGCAIQSAPPHPTPRFSPVDLPASSTRTSPSRFCSPSVSEALLAVAASLPPDDGRGVAVSGCLGSASTVDAYRARARSCSSLAGKANRLQARAIRWRRSRRQGRTRRPAPRSGVADAVDLDQSGTVDRFGGGAHQPRQRQLVLAADDQGRRDEAVRSPPR